MSTAHALPRLLLLVAVLAPLAPARLPAADRPYVAIYKSPAGAYLAGIKHGRSFTDAGGGVEQTGVRDEVVPGLTAPGKTTKVYEFTAVEGGYVFHSALPPGMTAYRPQAAGNGGEMMAEGIANALTFFATMYAPVVRITQGGREVSTCEFLAAHDAALAESLPECRSGASGCKNPQVPFQGVCVPHDPKKAPLHPDDVVHLDPGTVFDARGVVKAEWFAANRDRLVPCTVLNSACVPAFYYFEGVTAPSTANSFSRFRFRTQGELFAAYEPDSSIVQPDVYVIAPSSLEPAQLEYVHKSRLGKWGVKAREVFDGLLGRGEGGGILGQ